MPTAAAGENSPRKSPNLAPAWQPGQSGNPNGRPKGSKNKLAEDFIAALAANFEKHGESTIELARKSDPVQYLKVIAAVLPKEVIHTVEEYGDLSDEDLERALLETGRALLELRKAQGGSGQAALPAPLSN